MIRLLITGLLLAITATQPLCATILIVVYTDDGYWIGADSVRSTDESGTPAETVCKVHETKFGLLLKGGPARTNLKEGGAFSTDKEIEAVLSQSSNAEEFKRKLESQMEQDVKSDMAYTLTNPNVTLANLSTTAIMFPFPGSLISRLTRNISLFEIQTDHPRGELILVKPHSESTSDNRTGRIWYLWSASSTGWVAISALDLYLRHGLDVTGQAVTIPSPNSVRMLSGPVPYEKPDQWVREPPERCSPRNASFGPPPTR